MRHFHRLAAAAAERGGGSADLEEADLDLLAELDRESDRVDPLLVRSLMIAYHRRACELALSGNHRGAQRYWDRAHEFWDQRIHKKTAFWGEYVASYNQGQQRQLQLGPDELQRRIGRRMAGLCVSICGGLIEEQEMQAARPYWEMACAVGGSDLAREVFGEAVNLDAVLSRLDPNRNPAAIYDLYRFLYDTIERKEVYEKIMLEMAYRQAVRELNRDNPGDFIRHIVQAGEFNANFRVLAEKLRRLGNAVISAIVACFNANALARTFREANRELDDEEALFSVVWVYANSIDSVAGGINTWTVPRIMDQILVMVYKDLLKK